MPYGMPPAPNPYAASPYNNYNSYAIQNRESHATSTTKKVTSTTPRPKTTTSTTPKPLEFELSIEDFFYLTQLHQMFNKSLDKQGIDVSSLSTKLLKKPGEEKDESRKYRNQVTRVQLVHLLLNLLPDMLIQHHKCFSFCVSMNTAVFYGGVLDLEELSKIDNMKDLMEVFRKGGTKPQTTVSRTDAESGRSDNPDDGDHEADEERETHPEANGMRKGSHGATRTRPTALRNRNKKKKKRRKESDRVDHEIQDDEEQPEEQDNEGSDDQETDDSEPETEVKIGIGSKPSSSSHFHASHKKQHQQQRVRTSTTTTTTTTAAPPVMYPNPYLFSLPYNYPQMQQQYVQQLQALSGQLQQSVSRPAEKEAGKFSDEEPLASPNENRNVINVNIADPRKVGDGLANDVSVNHNHNQETLSASRLPLRRGSFNSMANGLAKKALSSILYRIFPTMKHLNVKGVAARGCRDVQSIGSLDSIIMPLGLAVTLHPLLLPLVPFLLLALGSIKAIESATCFVSEYFT
jgi:hypothetical protein